MENCDICGKKSENLYETNIEGSVLFACSSCASIAGKNITGNLKKTKQEYLVENYSDLIKKSREKSGMSLKEFALSINEKYGLLKNIESGKMKPDTRLCKKLEKSLKIKLLCNSVPEFEQNPQGSSKMTIADVLLKKR